jgi:DHA2 family multidrug resistance protein-like MFS transporter
LGGVLAPLLGGALLSHFHWGSVFFVAVPIMLILLAAGPILLPEVSETSTRKIDVPSVIQLMLAVIAGTYAMKDAASHGVGWTPAILLAVAVVTGASFLRRQKRVPNPLVQTELFRSAVFSTAMTANSLALLAWVGASLLVTQHIQLVLALSAMPAAMWMLPSALACVAGCLAAPGLARRWWNGRDITLGLFLSTLGLAALAASAARFGLAAIVPAMRVLGFGVSLVVTLSTDIILSGAPADLAGSASSLSETAADLGGALGVAILGSVGLAVYRLRVSLPSGLDSAQQASATDGLSGAVQTAASLPAHTAVWLLESARSAYGQGLGVAAATGAVLLLFTTLVSWSVIGCYLKRPAAFKGGSNV